MINRRAFLGGALAVSAMRRLRADGPCTDQDVISFGSKLGTYTAPGHGKAPGFNVDVVLGSARRPLWSELAAQNKMAEYGKNLLNAYREMIKLPVSDPRSLVHQGWLHWVRCPMLRDSSREDIHHGSGFLPWHRAYLYYFERLIQSFTNPAFRLAAWDWEAPNNLAIPSIYSHPDLFPAKYIGCEYARDLNPRIAVGNIVSYLQSDRVVGASHCFLGGADFNGTVTAGPHDGVHIGVGGLMGDLSVAAFDPLFFAHHANIDRLWDFWYRRYKSVPGFFDGQTWPVSKKPWVFFDALTNRFVTVEPKNLLQMESLGYHYTPPRISLFDYTTLSANPGANMLAFPKDAVQHSLDAVNKALTDLPGALELGGQLSLERILSGARDFSLPVVARFSGLEHAASKLYNVSINGVPVGGFSVPKGGHSSGAVTAFLSLSLDRVSSFLESALSGSLIISLEPGDLNASLRLNSFELRYPKCPEAWIDLIAPPDPLSYHDCPDESHQTAPRLSASVRQ